MREADEREGGREEPGAASPYLRRARRVEVRRGARWRRWVWIGLPAALGAGGAAGAAAYAVNAYLTRSPRFRLEGTLTVVETRNVAADQITRVFAADQGRSVFATPLEKRRQQVAALPWVESAWVSRGWPNRLRVVVTEREPNGAVAMVDREGVWLPSPRRGRFVFPMLRGVDESMTNQERKKRVTRMLAVLEDLDRESPKRSPEISEIDLSDPDDAAVTVTPGGAAVRVHLGDGRYLERYRYFLANIQGWREQYGAVRSVDLRFENQVIVR
jgi:cell division protein FtsQ